VDCRIQLWERRNRICVSAGRSSSDTNASRTRWETKIDPTWMTAQVFVQRTVFSVRAVLLALVITGELSPDNNFWKFLADCHF
jgi:hypothetical protein